MTPKSSALSAAARRPINRASAPHQARILEIDLMEPQGRIINFYSYKGGTGRSMTLANVAWILASNGKQVLTIDWDLEAPGLHRYFMPFLVDKELKVSEGLMDMIDEFRLATITPKEDSDDNWHESY